MTRVLVTGGTGFIGTRLVRRFAGDPGFAVSMTARGGRAPPSGVRMYPVKDLRGCSWSDALAGTDVVVHLAGMAHVQDALLANQLSEFRAVNRDATVALARQAARAGVRRFVFVSTIGVNGPSSRSPFVEEDEPRPTGPYAASKLEAELALWELAHEMEIVVVRPTLVYGKGAPGNIAKLLAVLQRGLPLPLGAIDNKRSFLSIENLVDFLVTCVSHPKAGNRLYLVADGEDVSTPEFIRLLALAHGCSPRLWPVPTALLEAGFRISGRGALVDKLIASLQVDSSRARRELGWSPPQGLREAILGEASGGSGKG